MIQTVSWKRGFWLVLTVALVLRLGFAVGVQNFVSETPGRLCLISGDAEGYWELAGKLAAFDDYSIHHPPRRLLRMPGFPALLAIPRFIFGDNPFAARIVLALVGTAACGLTYWLGRELAGEAVGLIAAAYTAISPTMVLFSVMFLSETAFAAAMLASLVATAKLVRRTACPTSSKLGSAEKRELPDRGGTNEAAEVPGFRQGPPTPANHVQTSDQAVDQSKMIRASHSTQGPAHDVALAIVTGLLIGLATYMRPTWILVGPGLAGCLLIFGAQAFRTRVFLGCSICLGLAVTLAPWTIRNFFVTGHFIPTTLWVGPSLYDGLNPTATGESEMTFFDQENLLGSMSEYDMDREYRRRAWTWAAANPGRVAELAAIKQARYWSPAPGSAQFKVASLSLVAWAFFLPLIGGSILGAWFARTDIWMLILTVAPILYFAVLHLLFVGSLRYRLPAEYPLAVLAAVGLSRITGRSDVAAVPSV